MWFDVTINAAAPGCATAGYMRMAGSAAVSLLAERTGRVFLDDFLQIYCADLLTGPSIPSLPSHLTLPHRRAAHHYFATSSNCNFDMQRRHKTFLNLFEREPPTKMLMLIFHKRTQKIQLQASWPAATSGPPQCPGQHHHQQHQRQHQQQQQERPSLSAERLVLPPSFLLSFARPRSGSGVSGCERGRHRCTKGSKEDQPCRETKAGQWTWPVCEPGK